MNIGTLLRKHRKKKKLTLRAVAEKASISDSFLSQVENNVNSPSVDTLMRICKGLEIDPGKLLTTANNQEKIVQVKKSDWKSIEISKSGFATRRFFPPDERSVIDSSVLALEAGQSIPVRKNVKNSQEVLCVLEGTIEFMLGEETFLLTQGDSVHFWANPEAQKITNMSSAISYVLWVGTM